MAKSLIVVPANELVAATLAMVDVLEDKKALFVSAAAVNGEAPRVEDLPSEVPDHIGCIVESSGSTGVPKRISISLKSLLHAARAGQQRLGPDGQWLLALPINFIAGQQVLARSVLSGTQPVIQNTAIPFTAEAFFRSALLLSPEVRYTSLVPVQLARVIKHAEQDPIALASLRKFRAILVGGQLLPDELKTRAIELGVNVVVSYGMSETAGGCVYDGIPLDGVRLKISPDGRLLISGKTMAEDLGEWIYTNDLAELTPEGKLRILGRADRVIVSGGLKLSLDRVEYLGSELAGVEQLAAVSLSDLEFGERVGIAYVGSPEVADDIVNSLAQLLGPIGKPVRVIRVDKLPRLATGKNDLISIAALFGKESK